MWTILIWSHPSPSYSSVRYPLLIDRGSKEGLSSRFVLFCINHVYEKLPKGVNLGSLRRAFQMFPIFQCTQVVSIENGILYASGYGCENNNAVSKWLWLWKQQRCRQVVMVRKASLYASGFGKREHTLIKSRPFNQVKHRFSTSSGPLDEWYAACWYVRCIFSAPFLFSCFSTTTISCFNHSSGPVIANYKNEVFWERILSVFILITRFPSGMCLGEWHKNELNAHIKSTTSGWKSHCSLGETGMCSYH